MGCTCNEKYHWAPIELVVKVVFVFFSLKIIGNEANISKQLYRLQRQPSSPLHVKLWKQDYSLLCHKIQNVMKQKDRILTRLKMLNDSIVANTRYNEDEKKLQLESFAILTSEFTESSHLIYQAIEGLEFAMQGDWRNILNMKESSKSRLDALRDATLKEEQEYNAILTAEKHEQHIQKERNHSAIVSVVDAILSDVAEAADKLELKLEDHVFDQVAALPDKIHRIEAVIKVQDDDAQSEDANLKSLGDDEEDAIGTTRLVDSRNNQYVLSKSKDSTIPHEDQQLIKDIVLSVAVGFLLSLLAHVIHLPTMFAYVITGVILGPSGYNYLKSLVQLETLGEFGAFFILFMVGMEFSPGKLRKVVGVASSTSVGLMLTMTCVGLVAAHLQGVSVGPWGFVAACLSLSSTPLVVKYLAHPPHTTSHSRQGSFRRHRTKSTSDSGAEVVEEVPGEPVSGQILLAILVMQDVLLGLLVAILPLVAKHNTPTASTSYNATVSTTPSSSLYVLQLAHFITRVVGAMVAALLISAIMSRYVVGRIFKYLDSLQSKEFITVAALTLAFLMLMVTDYLHISMEVGCFLAGVTLSSQGKHLVDTIDSCIVPLRDFCALIFFVSIGLHVFPSFVAIQLTVLASLTLVVVGVKFLVSLSILHLVLPKELAPSKYLIATGLAQVSEFSFVLASRARRLHLIGREVYLIILSITTLSLALSPLLWKVSMFHDRGSVLPVYRRLSWS